MAKKRPTRRRITVSFPATGFRPADLLTFIELTPFTRRWKQLDLGDEDLAALQVAVLTQPRAGAVIEHAGGLRKLRFAPPGQPIGKRGAMRVCYAYFEGRGDGRAGYRVRQNRGGRPDGG